MTARLAAVARQLAGLILLTLLAAGLPYALVHVVGWPLSRQIPTWQDIGTMLTTPLTDAMLGNAVVCLLWLAWAAFVWSLLAELLQTLAGIRLPQPKAIAPARGLAAILVAAVTGGILATGAQAAPTRAGPAAPGHGAETTATAITAVAVPATVTPAPTASAGRDVHAGGDKSPQMVPAASHLTVLSSGRTYTCVVERGDTLSEIAKQWLGDANRWPEIFALNRGRHFRDVGGTFTNPHLIYPGWVLELPDDATPPASARPRTTPRPADPDNRTPEQAAPVAPPVPTRSPHTGQPPSANPSPSPTQAHDRDDGVVEPEAPPAATVTPTGPSPTPEPEATATPEMPSEEQAPTPESSPGVALGTGSWFDLGLVAAILGGVALVWAHRRRRYTPRQPTPQLRMDDPTVAPMPDVVIRIRRGLRRPATTPTAATTPDTPLDELIADPDANETDATDDEPDSVPTDVSQPVTPALASPVIEVWPPAGLGLTGAGAEAAARGFLVSALAAGGLDDPNGRGYVVIPSGTLATLLGAAAVTVPDTPRLTVTGGLTDALTLLEEQTLHRTRVCFDHEVDTITGLRDVDPMAEPLPPMVLIADTTAAHERARIAALLTQGQRLDIHGVLLGAWPDGDTLVVAPDGSTSPAEGDAHRHGRHPANVGRLTVIDQDEAADLLRVLAESHTGEPQPPAPAERTPLPAADTHSNAEAADTSSGVPPNGEEAVPPDPAEPNREPATATPAPDEPAEERAAAEPPTQDDQAEAGEDDAAQPDDSEDAGTGRVDVRVLGDARVIDIDTTQPLRGKSLELLVYLAARGGTASQEAILEDLLPEAASSKAPHRLHTYVYNLRRVLKQTGGSATYLSHPDRRYILHREAVDVDLWRMSDALDEANRATSPTDRIAALRRAVDAYQGPLAGSRGYEWIEPYREAVQRQAVDTALALAEALVDQPGEALAVLTTAMSHSPYAEVLYQATMRAHAALGDGAAIRDLQRQLARSLDEIDTEVSDETTALARALVNRLQRGRRVGGESKGPS